MRDINKFRDVWTGIAYSKNPELMLANLVGKIIERRQVMSMDLEENTIPEQFGFIQGFIKGLDFVLGLPQTVAASKTDEDKSSEEEDTV
jgi:hypothetical protein